MILVSYFCLYSCNTYQKISYENTTENTAETERIYNKYDAVSRRLLYDLYKDYIKYADFKSEIASQTTESDIFDFKSLFDSDASIYNDLQLDNLEYEYLSIDSYAAIVSSYMYRNGVNCDLEELTLNDFFSTSLIFEKPKIEKVYEDYLFTYAFIVEKKMYRVVNTNNQVLDYEEPIEHKIEISARISIENELAKIVSIKKVE